MLQSWKNQLVEPGAVARCMLYFGVLWKNSFFIVVGFVVFFHEKRSIIGIFCGRSLTRVLVICFEILALT